MSDKSIKSIFKGHWDNEKIELSGRYSQPHWESIVEAVEKMINCRDPSNGYAKYICPNCFKKK